jgi:hypothetical protein
LSKQQKNNGLSLLKFSGQNDIDTWNSLSQEQRSVMKKLIIGLYVENERARLLNDLHGSPSSSEAEERARGFTKVCPVSI